MAFEARRTASDRQIPLHMPCCRRAGRVSLVWGAQRKIATNLSVAWRWHQKENFLVFGFHQDGKLYCMRFWFWFVRCSICDQLICVIYFKYYRQKCKLCIIDILNWKQSEVVREKEGGLWMNSFLCTDVLSIVSITKKKRKKKIYLLSKIF